MAGTPAVGTGTTLTLGGITLTVDRLSIGMSGISRESIETTHFGTGSSRTFIPSDLYDPGSLEVSFHLDSTTPATTMAVETIMTDATIDWTLVMNEGGDWAGNGFVVGFSWNLPLEELATGSFTLKCSGGITTAN